MNNSQQTKVNKHQPTNGSQQAATSKQQPTNNSQQIIYNKWLPMNNNQWTMTNKQEPTKTLNKHTNEQHSMNYILQNAANVQELQLQTNYKQWKVANKLNYLPHDRATNNSQCQQQHCCWQQILSTTTGTNNIQWLNGDDGAKMTALVMITKVW